MTEPATLPDAEALTELEPLLRRAVDVNPGSLVRLRSVGSVLTAFVTVFDVLVGRSVRIGGEQDGLDLTAAAADVIAAIESGTTSVARRDADWRGSVPPLTGWQRIDSVPDESIRALVRSGALALKEAGDRGPGLSARAPAAEALLDSVVLTVAAEDATGTPSVEITLRMVSALTRMGFLPRGSEVGVDLCGGWTRLAGGYGAVFARPAGLLMR